MLLQVCAGCDILSVQAQTSFQVKGYAYMFYSPEGYTIGDTWQYSCGPVVHAFFLQWRGFDDMSDTESGSIGHIVSDDMLKWTELPCALVRGGAGEYDELDLWTGSCVGKDGRFYLFYTSRNRNNPDANAISVAVSDDGVNFKKYERNPVLVPCHRFYCGEKNKTPLAVHGNQNFSIVDCRDMHVVYDSKSGYWYGYTAMRKPANECTETSVIACARSCDLLAWESLPPCFAPDRYHCIETPDVFEMNGRWYMLCLTGNHYGQRNTTGDPGMEGCLTIYAVSDSPVGPFTEPENNVLLGSSQLSGICAKTVLREGERYLFYTQANGEKRSLSFPKRVISDDSGRLHLMWYEETEKLFIPEPVYFTADKALANSGKWGSIVPVGYEGNSVSLSPAHDWAVQIYDISAGSFVLDTHITAPDAHSIGIVFGLKGDNIYSDNRLVLADFDEGAIWLTRLRNFPRTCTRRHTVDRNGFDLKLAVLDTAVEVYINGELVLHYQADNMPGKLGFYAERGRAVFDNTVLYRVKDL